MPLIKDISFGSGAAAEGWRGGAGHGMLPADEAGRSARHKIFGIEFTVVM
ncbi:MAG: hypothetical protein GX425_10100 [Peptococcaceae bacterium]|nr:hypothetical protein [Peptococcaceae bacterium]